MQALLGSRLEGPVEVLIGRLARQGWQRAGAVRSPRLNFAFHRGMHRFYRRWEAPARPLPVNIAVYAGIYAKLAVSLVRGAFTRLAGRAQ